jgi:hypothetical protein
MKNCIVCLDNIDTNLQVKLCDTCEESYACKECVNQLENTNNHAIIMNCPICRKANNLLKKPILWGYWHMAITIYWQMVRFEVPLWTQFFMLLFSYRYMETVCRIINSRDDQSNPRMLRRRWIIWNNTTFLPYMISTYFYSSDLTVGNKIGIFTFGHLVFPILSVGFLYGVRIFLQVCNLLFDLN